MALWLTQPLTETSTRNIPGSKVWPASKANNRTSSASRFSRKCVNVDISQPYWPPRPAVVIAILKQKKKINSVACIRERTILTERPPLVGEISANFLLIESATWSA
jgi:hypothetical protein